MNSLERPNYTQIPNTLLDQMNLLSDAELRVMLAVCRQTFGWHKEKAVMSSSFIAKATGMSEQGVINGVRRLLESGLLQRSKQGNSFAYFVRVADETLNGVEGAAPQNPQRRLEAPLNAVEGQPAQTLNAVETNKESKPKKTNKAAALPPIPPELKSPEFEHAWLTWLEHRKQLRKPVTASTAEFQFKKMLPWGPVKAVTAIYNAIEKGWTSMFEPREEVKPAMRNGFRPNAAPVHPSRRL